MRIAIAGFTLLTLSLLSCGDQRDHPAPSSEVAIVIGSDASPLETLAARELRRYVWLRAGEWLSIVSDAENADTAGLIVIGRRDSAVWQKDIFGAETPSVIEPQEYEIRSVTGGGRKSLLIHGGAPVGALYGTYRFIETLGVRFYLHGDTVPDGHVALSLDGIAETGKPLFDLRGIQPFHDFPEGPDWWELDDYKATIAQLAKMRMNFVGLHTYPEGRVGPEPAVWIGPPSEAGSGGTVTASYPARHFTTQSGTWGYAAKNTGDYSFGAGQLFDRDAYGAEYMRGMTPWPPNPEAENDLFDRYAAVLRESFTFARRLGLKTCVGTETPLTIPKPVQDRLRADGKDPSSDAVIQEVYEGIFQRIAAAHPLDYYWFWTPEDWTWKGNTSGETKAAERDLRLAYAAAKKTNAPFTLATCGWVLGPKNDRSMFDSVLPKEMPMSAINRNVGFAPVDPAYARIEGRPKWVIPWMEDDPAMIVPQLWVGRMRRDAADAHRYGASGLVGIHWRTRILGPNVAALAAAGWEQGWAGNVPPGTSDMPVEDFYADWARTQFGDEIAEAAAQIFASHDGGPRSAEEKDRETRLPRPATWIGGPGGIKPDPRPWEEVGPEYAFVDEFAALGSKVTGAGNRERFDYWSKTFEYLRAVGHLNCLWGAKAGEEAMNTALGNVYRYLFATISSTGELGTVANWEQHLLPMLKLEPEKEYTGEPRLIVPTLRSVIEEGEDLRVKAIIMARDDAASVTLRWSPLGGDEWQTMEFEPAGRGVFRVSVPGSEIGTDIEYNVTATMPDGEELHFPATAPARNQTVVRMPVAPPDSRIE